MSAARKPRLFFDGTAMLPTRWRRVAGFERHIVQGDVAVVAPTKAAAVDLLVTGGLDRAQAEALVKDTRMRKHDPSDWPTQHRRLAEAGVLDPNVPMAVAFHHGARGDAVVRVDDPALPIVAWFEYESGINGRGIYVEVAQ